MVQYLTAEEMGCFGECSVGFGHVVVVPGVPHAGPDVEVDGHVGNPEPAGQRRALGQHRLAVGDLQQHRREPGAHCGAHAYKLHVLHVLLLVLDLPVCSEFMFITSSHKSGH